MSTLPTSSNLSVPIEIHRNRRGDWIAKVSNKQSFATSNWEEAWLFAKEMAGWDPCEGHFTHVCQLVPATRVGLCDACARGEALAPGEEIGSYYRFGDKPEPTGKSERVVTDVEEVFLAVAAAYGITANEISRHKNTAAFVRPRSVVTYLLHKCLGYSFTEIGKLIGFARCTVRYQFKNAQELMRADKEYKAIVESLVVRLERTEITA